MIWLFASLIISHQLLLFLIRKRFDPFNVVTLIDIVLFVMWVYAPLVDNSLHSILEEDWEFALITFFGVIFLYIGLHIPALGRRQLMSPGQSNTPIYTRRWLWLALIVFVISTLLHTWQTIQYVGGSIWEYFTGGRVSIYAMILNEINKGSVFSGIISFTRPIILLWLGISLEEKRWKHAMFLYCILLIGILMIATTRGQIIITLLLPLFYFYYSRFRNRRSPFGVFTLTALAAVAILFWLYVLNLWRTKGLEAFYSVYLSLRDVLNSLQVNFKPMYGYYMLWQHRNNLSLEYGLSYLYVLVTMIPRALWPDKPIVSHEARWTTYFFGQHFAAGTEESGVWTFTVWGEGLTQFGIPGVFLNLFLYGYIVNWASNRFGKTPQFSIVWFYYSIFAATYLRSSFSSLAWDFITLLPMIYVYKLSTCQRVT